MQEYSIHPNSVYYLAEAVSRGATTSIMKYEHKIYHSILLKFPFSSIDNYYKNKSIKSVNRK